MMQIMLSWGPSELARLRELDVVELPAKITVDFGGRHHHFCWTAEVERVAGAPVPVFSWSYDTAIAY